LRVLFDSSVLVPVFYADHIHHEPSAQAFLAARKDDSFCALRSLGEIYATLTGLPLRPRIVGPEAMTAIREIRKRLTVVSLSDEEYVATLQELSDVGIVGGAAYDALIARCALKMGAEIILTWNVKHFVRFGEVTARRVRTPLELPANF